MRPNNIKIFFAPLDIIETKLLEIIEDSKRKAIKEGILSKCPLNLHNCFFEPEYISHEDIAVFWQPLKQNYTIMLTNLWDGWVTLGYLLNIVKGVKMLDLSLFNDCVKFNFNNERFIRVMWDSKWDFYELGQPLFFENTEQYKVRLKKRRLTIDMVIEYTKFLGVDLMNPEIYKTDKEALYYIKPNH